MTTRDVRLRIEGLGVWWALSILPSNQKSEGKISELLGHLRP